MTNLHFLGLVQYHAKWFKIEWVLFDILRGSPQRALFMVGGFITTLNDSIRNQHNYDLNLDRVSYSCVPSLKVTNEFFLI